MRLFIKHILVIALMILMLSLLLWIPLRTQINPYSNKHKQIQNRADSVELIILGNSYAESGVNPHVFNLISYNAALAGRTIYYDYKLLSNVIDEMPYLRCVIFPVGLIQPFCSLEKGDFEKQDIFKYYHFMNINPQNWYEYVYISSLVMGQANIEKLYDEVLTYDELGWGKLISDSGLLLENNPADSVWMRSNKAKRNIDNFKRLLSDMAEMCCKRDVKLILFTPPYHSSYLQEYPNFGYVTVHGIVENLTCSYPNVIYIDYSDSQDFEDEVYFYNPSHLNADGATKLSMLLSQFVNR